MKHDPRTDTALDLSLSEISALTTRATRGAGRTWGEAEEAAEAACWLARAGLDWAGALLEVLQPPEAGADCALRTGIALADAAALSGPPKAQRTINSPCFLLPFAARMADQTGQRIRVTAAETQIVLAPGACPLMVGPGRMSGPALVALAPDQQDQSPCPDWPQTHRGMVLATEYARLTQLMMAFTVPTSAHSRAGAGAQGDDND
ncbi:MAG: DUF3726 domain-containing protein [Rhodobacteraceae bacterium]|nr:MAG: DUF3726 domain-containing protein [Paracoccaceae bacterium]